MSNRWRKCGKEDWYQFMRLWAPKPHFSVHVRPSSFNKRETVHESAWAEQGYHIGGKQECDCVAGKTGARMMITMFLMSLQENFLQSYTINRAKSQ